MNECKYAAEQLVPTNNFRKTTGVAQGQKIITYMLIVQTHIKPRIRTHMQAHAVF